MFEQITGYWELLCMVRYKFFSLFQFLTHYVINTFCNILNILSVFSLYEAIDLTFLCFVENFSHHFFHHVFLYYQVGYFFKE